MLSLSKLDRIGERLARLAPDAVGTLSRLTFAAVLAGYFWASAQTKLGAGFWGFVHPSDGAYAQIFPRAAEAVGYDTSQLGALHWAVVVAGTWAEFLLPLLIVAGFLTRMAAFGMMGFILVQSLTDIYGHGVAGADLGRWFDSDSAALILDQRALWVTLLLGLVFCGAGPISLDRLHARLRR